MADFVSASPHRSFRKTDRRYVPKPVKLPSYIRFTREVLDLIRTHRMVFIRLGLVIWLVLLLMVGFSQQSRYLEIKEVISGISDQVVGAEARKPLELGATLTSIFSGSLNSSLSESQQIYMVILYIFVWLAVVWLLRHAMAGTKVGARDALYNAGAPILPTLIIFFVGSLQLLPGAVALSIFSAAQQSGLLSSGIEVAVFFLVAVLALVLSLYWVVSTFFAGIIVTIPGTYPLSALRSARKLVVGQRRQILFRLAWLGLIVTVTFAIIALPAFLIDEALHFSNYPFVSAVILFMTVSLLMFSITYIYLLYRKIIDERS